MENKTVIKSLETLAGSQMPITLSSNHTWLEGFVDNVLKQAFCELVITLKSTSVGDFILQSEAGFAFRYLCHP
ncbi:hypothetical protein PN36_07790 [Candidatus Thiomargarita nelsonii]|uniref:Uncharacterized protein n=1 Tax=Candidatus Thiomargarita nelsonii TaxID=1003181 RepID=A0A4E0QVD0_9GAMM|nr:hypothetical protein PN36_07790 [Candidatus Thiomargarita nelsonii]